MTLTKIMKAKKRRKDYEKKKNIIRNNKKRVVLDRDRKPSWGKPRVTLPAKTKPKQPKPGVGPGGKYKITQKGDSKKPFILTRKKTVDIEKT